MIIGKPKGVIGNSSAALVSYIGRYQSSIWGFSDFMALGNLRDSSKGFLVNDCIIIEAHIKKVLTTKLLPLTMYLALGKIVVY